MTSLDNLTSAFECLWEAKIYLLRTQQQTGDAKIAEILKEVATARDHIEAALIELQARPASAPVPPTG